MLQIRTIKDKNRSNNDRAHKTAWHRYVNLKFLSLPHETWQPRRLAPVRVSVASEEAL